MSLLPLFVLFALTCCLLPSLSCSQISPDMLPTITSVSGCSDVGTATYNCSYASERLTIYGRNFRVDPVKAESMGVAMHGWTASCWVDYPIFDTNLTCSPYTERSIFSDNRQGLEAVSLWYWELLEENGQWWQSAAFDGVQFLTHPFSTLTAIRGCDDSNNADGQYTAHCQPDTDVITLTGTEFGILTYFLNHDMESRVEITIGGVNHRTQWTYVDDSTITIELSDIYSRVVIPDHYTGTPLEVHLTLGQLHTNRLQISFVTPIPPPQVSALTSYGGHPTAPGCQSSSTNPLHVGGCWPGRSEITITGHYFYDPLTVFIGGKPCNLTGIGVYGKEITCIVPLLDNYVPGLYYDLTINDTAYWDDPEVGILPASVAFLSGPILSNIVPCIATLSVQYDAIIGKCQPGQRLTIVGTDFLPRDPNAYITMRGNFHDFGGNCTDLEILDNEHLACTLPDLGDISRWTGVDFVLYANGNTSTRLTVWAYESAHPFIVTGMSGCASGESTMVDGIPTLTGCLPGEWINVHVTNLNYTSTKYWEISCGNYPTASMGTGYSSDTLIAAWLPYADYILWDTPLYYTLYQDVTSISNPFALVYSVPTAPAQSSSTGASSSSSSSSAISSAVSSTASAIRSSSSGSTSSTGSDSADSGGSSGLSRGAVAGVVIAAVTGALLALAAVVWLCRRQSSNSKESTRFQSHSDESDSSSATTNYDSAAVELQQRE